MELDAEFISHPESVGFHYYRNPVAESLAESTFEFLKQLPGPTHIHIQGQNSNRCRAAATLLHGNEPSGLYAIHATLKQQIQPVVDIHYFIPSVDAAKQAPGFIYRMLPHNKDLNRCFKLPFGDTEQDLLAKALLDRLQELQPECLIDIHNTSGSSPSFGITTFMDARHDALVSLFTHRLIVTDLKLGSLMDISETLLPAVTIECGGAQDNESNLMATDGLVRYLQTPDVLSPGHTDMNLEFFHRPIRVELQPGSDIAFGDHCLLTDGITLRDEIENFNFGYIERDDPLGYLSGSLQANLTAKDTNGQDRLLDYFEERNGELYPTRTLKLFMVTTNPEIARKDCLFYFVEPD